MFVDLNLSGRSALVVSQGAEAESRSKQLLDEGAKVTLVTRRPTRRLREFATRSGIELSALGVEDLTPALKSYNPFLVVICTGDEVLDRKIAASARSLVYVVDRPNLSDLSMVALAKIGDIRVGISTQGSSPAMSGLLRRRIENLIKPRDVRQVRLQGEIRSTVKNSIPNPVTRKKIIYKLIQDKKICSLLGNGRFEEAKEYALKMVEQFSHRHRRGISS